MQYKFPCRLLAVLLSLSLLLGMTGCSNRDATKIVYDLAYEPATVDPQCASDEAAFIAINSLFEGLFTIKEDGTLQNGVTKDYTISEDGLTYTFILKENITWSDGTDLTAHDFVFAFQRLFDPNTAAVTAKSFYCIENAKAIAEQGADPATVGVTAPSDHTLVIRLEYPNSMFLQLLTTAPAMPCNEAFFLSCKGEYGLEADKLISNGPYELVRWVHDDNGYLKLTKNEKYDRAKQVDLDAISLWTCYTEEERLKRFLDGTTNTYLVNGSTASISEAEATISTMENTVWGLTFNFHQTEMQNKNFRLAIASCFDRSRYASLLTPNLTVAESMIPSSVFFGETPYNTLSECSLLPFDETAAHDYYQKALSQLGVDQLSLTVIVEEDAAIDHASYFAYISQIIQKMELFCTVEVLPTDEYEDRLALGEYDMAICKVKAEYNHPLSVLEAFSTGDDRNLIGYHNTAYSALTHKVLLSTDEEEALQNIRKAEQHLIENAVFIPLYHQADYLATAPDVSGVMVNDENGLLTFQYAVIE